MRHHQLQTDAQLVLLAADGSGTRLELGPLTTKQGAAIRSTFSPDGTRLLVTYDTGPAYLFSIPDGTGGPIDTPGLGELSWQRLGD